jgi:WD40 repeat protein
LQHEGGVLVGCFSPDGKLILTGSQDKTARLWRRQPDNAVSPPVVLSHDESVLACAFSPDGQTVLTGCRDNTARLWEAHTGQPLEPVLAHPSAVSAVGFSPDGRTIVTGSWDQAVRLWDRVTGKLIRPPLQHPDTIDSVDFSSDGKMLLTGSGNAGRLWEIPAPVGDDAGEVTRWAEFATGLNLDDKGDFRVLSTQEWHDRAGKNGH